MAIDWAAAETLLALGICPIGIADLGGFLRSFPGTLPACSIADLGSTWEPNLELIDRMGPALIYISPWNALAQAAVEDIAPVRISPIYAGKGRPLETARSFAEQIHSDFPQASDPGALAALENRHDRLRGVCAETREQPVLIVNLHGSGRFANVYGGSSMAGNVLEHIGMQNAWTERTNGFGFARIGIERLVEIKAASIVVIDQGEQTARALRILDASAIWKAVPVVRSGKTHLSPPLSIFGGLATAVNFAEWLVGALGRDG